MRCESVVGRGLKILAILGLFLCLDGAAAEELDSAPRRRLPIAFRHSDSAPPSHVATASAALPINGAEPLPLAPRTRPAQPSPGASPPTAGRAIATILSSLAVVAGILVVIAWLARKYHPAARGLPDEVFVHLGTTSLASRQSVHVLRFGEKLLLVAATASGLQTLAELTHPDEVQRLSGLCQPQRSSPIKSTLQRVLAEWTNEASAASRAPRQSAPIVVTPRRMGDTSHA